jgi:flagellar hook-basal body complex protein FliE
MPSISGINPISPPSAVGTLDKPSAVAEKQFSSLFSEAIGHVEGYRTQAENSTNRFMAGEPEELHQVILAGQRAEIAFETFLQVRNKVVQAYQEVMRMQM